MPSSCYKLLGSPDLPVSATLGSFILLTRHLHVNFLCTIQNKHFSKTSVYLSALPYSNPNRKQAVASWAKPTGKSAIITDASKYLCVAHHRPPGFISCSIPSTRRAHLLRVEHSLLKRVRPQVQTANTAAAVWKDSSATHSHSQFSHSIPSSNTSQCIPTEMNAPKTTSQLAVLNLGFFPRFLLAKV